MKNEVNEVKNEVNEVKNEVNKVNAVFERLILDMDGMKRYLQVDHNNDDLLIEQMFDSVKEFLDAYLQNDFTDEDGNELMLPMSVLIVAMRLTRSLYYKRDDLEQSKAVSGVSVSYNDNLLQYTQSLSLIAPYRVFEVL